MPARVQPVRFNHSNDGERANGREAVGNYVIHHRSQALLRVCDQPDEHVARVRNSRVGKHPSDTALHQSAKIADEHR